MREIENKDVNLETVKEITKTIKELNPDRNWLVGMLCLYVATSHKQSTPENNSFCSSKKDTVYVMPMQLKVYQDSIQIKDGGSK